MQRYFAKLAYDGTFYYGWQIQPEDASVQQFLNESLSTIFRESIETTGCGRTDKGVHASLFYAHFDVFEKIENVEKALFQLNALLPRDIRVYDLIPVAEDAHARFDARLRSYSYYIKNKANPFLDNYYWYNRQALDIDIMNEAGKICLSHIDYECFAKSGGKQSTMNCIVSDCKWIELDSGIRFTISANRFLRGMVRAMVGTFHELGTGKISLHDFKSILESKNRSEAGKTVPAQGLFLEQVMYPYIKDERLFPFTL